MSLIPLTFYLPTYFLLPYFFRLFFHNSISFCFYSSTFSSSFVILFCFNHLYICTLFFHFCPSYLVSAPFSIIHYHPLNLPLFLSLSPFLPVAFTSSPSLRYFLLVFPPIIPYRSLPAYLHQILFQSSSSYLSTFHSLFFLSAFHFPFLTFVSFLPSSTLFPSLIFFLPLYLFPFFRPIFSRDIFLILSNSYFLFFLV